VVGSVGDGEFGVGRDVEGFDMAVVGESGVGVQVGVPIGESLVYVGQEAGRVMLRRFVGRMGNAVDCGGAVGG